VLELIVSSLPAEFPVPIVVAQHMPAIFTRSFAERMDVKCDIAVVEAEDGMPLRGGVVYIAPGERHTHEQRGRTCRYSLRVDDDAAGGVYRPSVDALLGSAASAAGSRTLGIVLTGMGDDGARGAGQIRTSSGWVLTQSARTCVVYGMPRAVEEAGASSASLSPLQLSAVLATLCRRPAAVCAVSDLRKAG
jgi:two-component system chemotaxis response regulator CheB